MTLLVFARLVLKLFGACNMKISCVNVPGGWQTVVYTADGGEYLFGPVYNRVTDLWTWQRSNLFNVVDGYVMREAA